LPGVYDAQVPVPIRIMARLERFELPTPWFVAKYSIQLSYRRVMQVTAATVDLRSR
jgi:hypothetical protein